MVKNPRRTSKRPPWHLQVTWASHDLNMFFKLGRKTYTQRGGAQKALRKVPRWPGSSLVLDLVDDHGNIHDNKEVAVETVEVLMRQNVRAMKINALRTQL